MKKLIFAALLTIASSINTYAAIGDLSADLVFTPITPCRIVDTRGAGGVIPGATSRVFKGWAANYTAQGGSSSTCGLPQTTDIAALAVNLLVIVPEAEGWIAAWPVGTSMPLVSNLNYKANDVLANSAILKINQTTADFNVYTVASTHLAVDVTGYYSKPVATALQCRLGPTATVSIAAGAADNGFAPACDAGYTRTATNCAVGGNSTMLLYQQYDGACSVKNTGVSAGNLFVVGTCCRVPGR